MSIPRLPFLYPRFIKTAFLHDPKPSSNALRIRQPQPQPQRASISTSKCLKQETYAQRYGSAAEPQPPLPPPGSSMPSKPQDEKSLAEAIEKEVKSPPKADEQKKLSRPPPNKETTKSSSTDTKDKSEENRDNAINTTVRDPAIRASELDASESHPRESALGVAAKNSENAHKAKPLETVLQMGAPTVEKPEEHRAPHLQAPPYVHHFDTFTLVRDLEKGGFSEHQSVTMMKAVRALLATNLDMAREGLVSKSDVENETYLFRAACSELLTEIHNTRKSSSTKTSTQLSHLKHTYDILSQRTSQETLSLKDDLRGMLNDRRMASRMESQLRDSEISELNNMISVRLNSDSRREVEGLRWVLTRRAAMAIAGMAGLILGSLRWSSYKLHEREIEARRMGVGGAGVGGGGGGGGGGSHTTPSREMGTQTEGQGAGVEKAENVGYVSLG